MIHQINIKQDTCTLYPLPPLTTVLAPATTNVAGTTMRENETNETFLNKGVFFLYMILLE